MKFKVLVSLDKQGVPYLEVEKRLENWFRERAGKQLVLSTEDERKTLDRIKRAILKHEKEYH